MVVVVVVISDKVDEIGNVSDSEAVELVFRGVSATVIVVVENCVGVVVIVVTELHTRVSHLQ